MRIGATVSAVCLAIAGAVLLFAPDEAGNVLVPGSNHPILVQVLGGALVGFGIANWTARGVLVQHGLQVGEPHPAYWVLTILFVVGAAFFSYLMFFSSGLRGR